MDRSHRTARTPSPLRTAAAAAVLCITGLTASQAMAARPDAAQRQAIEQTYRAERAACLDGSSSQDRRACLAEAVAVRKEALRGELGVVHQAGATSTEPTPADLMANALLRCDALPAEVRSDCARRVNGEGTVIGSVAEGIIIRELPAQPAPPVMALAPQPQPVSQPSAASAEAAPQQAVQQPDTAAIPAGTALAPGETLAPTAPMATAPADPAAAVPAEQPMAAVPAEPPMAAVPAEPPMAAVPAEPPMAAVPADATSAVTEGAMEPAPADAVVAVPADDTAARPADGMAGPGPDAAADPTAQPQR